jgi:hypothetical protein
MKMVKYYLALAVVLLLAAYYIPYWPIALVLV